MIAMELSGIHIGKRIKITWRFPSWAKKRATSTKIATISEVHHYAKGDVKIDWSAARYPFNAEVELLD